MCLLTGSYSLASSKKVIVRAASKQEMILLREVDQKYQKKHGIHLTLRKTVVLGILGTSKKSEGEIWLDQGKMRLEIHRPEASKIVADKSFLWIESPAPEGFKDAKVQVLKASLKSKQAKTQGLLQLLTQGGVLKYFRVSGVQHEDKRVVFFLQPNKQSSQFKRAQIKVVARAKEIVQLRYWDAMDNETIYDFTKSEFNKSLESKIFSYRPPQNAKVTIY